MFELNVAELPGLTMVELNSTLVPRTMTVWHIKASTPRSFVTSFWTVSDTLILPHREQSYWPEAFVSVSP